MNDDTFRRGLNTLINMAVESNDEKQERERLQKEHGKVWNPDELRVEFEVIGFMAPFVAVQRKVDGVKGTLMFQHAPRFYFNFAEVK